MAKWTHSKNLSLKDKTTLIKHEAKATQSFINVLWAFALVAACIAVYLIK
jgi:hypothetical protein